MRTTRVFFNSSLSVGSQVNLTKEQAHYLGRVLRLKVGHDLILFNGQGGEFQCRIAALDGKSGLIDVLEYLDIDRESPLNLCLAAALSKGDRFDWLLQKATELGVTSVQPILSERTEVRFKDDRLSKKVQHWQGVVRSACEQSGRTVMPLVASPLPFSEYIHENKVNVKLILDPSGSTSLAGISMENAMGAASLLVGPEGGFSDTEVKAANKEGYVSVRMGPRILRTETAPLAALAVIQSEYGDW